MKIKYLLLLSLCCPAASIGQQAYADSIINPASIQENLKYLSQDGLNGRLTGSVGGDQAASFIAAQFKSIGLKPVAGNGGYMDSFPITLYRQKRIGKNVVGAIAGKFTNDTMVIFSAHYDHIGVRNDLETHKPYDNSDYIFNGANDNATGVTALIELARYYKALDSNRYLLLFVAFAGEEMGMLGSEYMAKKTNPAVVKALINLEMLGRPEDGNCFVISFRDAAISGLLNKQLQKYQPNTKKFFQTDPYPDENLVERSDHYPFTRKITNAFTIMGSSPQDEYYHSADDEFDTINLDFLLKATRNIALACEQFTR